MTVSPTPGHWQQGASVTAFAPATIGNVGPGFDILGLAVDAGVGDTVTARFSESPGVKIVAIEGDNGRLPRDAAKNTAGIAAIATLAKAGVTAGIALTVKKGMPIGSGLGSSAASAAAAAFAVNRLVGSPLRKIELIGPCVEAEASVSGRHADNVAPAILGGLVLVRDVDPLDLVRIPIPEDLWVTVVTPRFELETKAARAALPTMVPMADRIRNAANIASFISACYSGDLGLLSRCVTDDVVNPARAALIPGANDALAAAMSAGALGTSISGAGPSIFAFSRSRRAAKTVGTAMMGAFAAAGLDATAIVSSADSPGVRTL